MVNITDKDRLYYSRVIDSLASIFQIADEFYKNDGLPTMPNEKVMDTLIVLFKKWLMTDEGADWLSDLGYHKKTIKGKFITHNMVSMCECCGDYSNKIDIFYCERCGRPVCNSCSIIVDRKYNIRWCEHCIDI